MTFQELPAFTRAALKHLPDDDLLDLQVHLLDHPDAGAVIPGAHGLRKLRWAAQGRGKRGGLRIIYYWMNAQGMIVLCRLYAKNEQENLSATETREILKQIQS